MPVTAGQIELGIDALLEIGVPNEVRSPLAHAFRLRYGVYQIGEV
jgi:hypothetical protein